MPPTSPPPRSPSGAPERPRSTIVSAAALALLAISTACQAHREDIAAAAETASASPQDLGAGLLYGRITTTDGDIDEGRLRFGGHEEALWGNQFNGVRAGNPWTSQVPSGQLPRDRSSIEILGFEVTLRGSRHDFTRPFMARLGDIARIDAERTRFEVTLKSGTSFVLQRFEADDLADGMRVWDGTRGMVNLDEWKIASIEFRPTPTTGSGPAPLHGIVHTAHGSFSGLIQWGREKGLLTDHIEGQGAKRSQQVGFDAIRSIERMSAEHSKVTLLDGQAIELSGTRSVGQGNRGVYVDDARYGRVLVPWAAFRRLDLSPAESAPPYTDFAPGRQLTGSVIPREGRRLAGRLVYDLDESETTETLDAPGQGVDKTIPFALIASISSSVSSVAAGTTITLLSGEVLQLEGAGDLSPQQGGILSFVAGADRAVYVPWREVERVEFDRP
ncbi:MAG: hypothetical protein SGI84_13125 [Gemmatimonadota bacterium]|mgnify:CR=1 FL=1|nr:hypothetical protein [Gemmatimonadota bacterium]